MNRMDDVGRTYVDQSRYCIFVGFCCCYYVPRTVTLVLARMAGDRLVPLRKTLQVQTPFSASVILAWKR